MNRIKLTFIMPHGKISTVCDSEDEVARCIRSVNTLCDEYGVPRPIKLFEEGETKCY